MRTPKAQAGELSQQQDQGVPARLRFVAEPRGRGTSHSLQRPVIQQQEEEGQRHHHRLGHESQPEETRHREVSPHAPAPDVRHVGGSAQQRQERAEDVLALGDPGHRLHVERVQGEERGHHGAAPGRAGERLQQGEEQCGVQGVEEDVGCVVAPGRQAEDLHVQHVGDPGDRVPVLVALEQGPGQARGREATVDVDVPRHVVAVVEAHELEADRLCVEAQGDCEERERDVAAAAHLTPFRLPRG